MENNPFKYLLQDHVDFGCDEGGCSIKTYGEYCNENCEKCRKLSFFDKRWYYGLRVDNFTNNVCHIIDEVKGKRKGKKKNKNWRYVKLKDIEEPIPLRREIEKGNEDDAINFALNVVYNYYHSTVDDTTKERDIYKREKSMSSRKKEIYNKRLLKILKDNYIEDNKRKYFSDIEDINLDARFLIEINVIIFLCKIDFRDLMRLLNFNI